jgi:hypothetical protein
MSMTRLVYGLAALPLIAGVAFAAPAKQTEGKALAKQPTQLSEQQMDKVTAGWDFLETTITNQMQNYISIDERRTAVVTTAGVATYGTGSMGNGINCATSSPCFLQFSNPDFAVAAAFYHP